MPKSKTKLILEFTCTACNKIQEPKKSLDDTPMKWKQYASVCECGGQVTAIPKSVPVNNEIAP